MDYRKAYEALSTALWAYEKEHHNAYVRLMLAVREIEERLCDTPAAPIDFLHAAEKKD